MGRLDDKFNDKVPALIERFRDTTDQLLDKSSVYDFATGENVPNFAGPWTVVASPAIDYTESEIDGTSILRGDKRIYVAAKSLKAETPPVTPSPTKNEYLKGGLTYQIVNVHTLESGDEVAAYELQLRR